MILENKKKNKESEEMRELMQEMMREIKEIRKQNEEYKIQMKQVKHDNEKLKLEVVENKQRLERIEKVLEQTERGMKRNNLIVKGIEMRGESGEGLKREMESLLKVSVGVDAELQTARRVSEKMYVIGMKNFEEKMEVLKHKKNLKGHAEKVFIQSDLTYKEREIQRIIRGRGAEERRNGKSTKIGYNYIIIDKTRWNWNSETESLEKEVAKN